MRKKQNAGRIRKSRPTAAVEEEEEPLYFGIGMYCLSHYYFGIGIVVRGVQQ